MINSKKAVDLSRLKSSRVADSILTQLGATGVKRLSFGSLTTSTGGGILNSAGEFIGGIVSRAQGFLGFASGLLGSFFRFTLTGLVGLVQNAFNGVWNFNWNVSDQEIDQQIQGSLIALSSLLGGTLGNATGWFACGGAVNAGIYALNPAMGAYVAKELGTEALEEFVGHLIALIFVSSHAAAQAFFLNSYRSNRALFTLFRNGAGTLLDQIVPGSLGWGRYVEQRTKERQVISFSDFVEESIESIKNPLSRAFFDEFFEELGDGCFESLYVVANSVESFMIQRRLQQQEPLGKNRIVEITPDRTAEQEKIILAGPQELLKPAIVSAVSNHQLLENRDIGQIVGIPLREHILTSPLGLRAQIILFPVSEPPFNRRQDTNPQRVTLTIPDFDRSKLTYSLIRAACGGSNGYTWGRFLAVAQLDNGRQMQAYGATAQEAEQQIQRMLLLTEAKLVKLNISEQQNAGQTLTNPRLRKEAKQVYPGYFYLINRDTFIDKTRGRSSVKGNFSDKRARIPIWREIEPPDWNDIVQEILTKGDL